MQKSKKMFLKINRILRRWSLKKINNMKKMKKMKKILIFPIKYVMINKMN